MRVQLTLRMPDELSRRVQLTSAACGMSANEFACAAMDVAVKTIAENDAQLAAVLEGLHVKSPFPVKLRPKIKPVTMSEPRAFLLPEHNAAYVQVSKVACSSIKIFIAGLLGIPLKDGDPHFTELPEARLPDVPSEYFVFAFVRNPWDRLVSCYRDKVGGEPGEFTHLNTSGIEYFFEMFEGMPFDDFVSAVAKIPDIAANEHYRSQHTFLTDRVDFIGRFERLDADFSHVLARLGIEGRLGHRQVSARKMDYRSFYTRATTDAVAQRYAEDIDRFGYRP